MILFFDTETTGLPDFKKPHTDPSMPHIVQLGAILCDANRRVVGEMNLIVRPNGYTIPEEASRVHGITQEMATDYGLKIESVMGLFCALVDRASTIVAHNLDFDVKMVDASLHRLKQPSPRPRETYCTMKASTDILKLPGLYGNKWPNLQEAHTHFLGKPFDGAHDAMADVRACMAVYYAMNPQPKE